MFVMCFPLFWLMPVLGEQDGSSQEVYRDIIFSKTLEDDLLQKLKFSTP